jgi:hypothetical protein
VIAYVLTRATPRLRAHHLAKKLGLEARYVCDDKVQARRLTTEYGLPRQSVIVVDGSPGPPTGTAYVRDYICRHIAPKDQWFAWLDDNVSAITGLPPGYSKAKINLDVPPKGGTWRDLFAHELTPDEVWYYLNETVSEAERLGTIDCGFATEENYYFRARKWQYFGYCRAQFGLYRNDGSGWMPEHSGAFEDFPKSVDVVVRYGCILINRHLKPIKPQFEAGGIGTLAERLPHLRESCAWLMAQYPGLLAYSKGRDYHLTFAKRSLKTVAEWRRKNGYLASKEVIR